MAEIYLARLAGEAGFEKIVVVKRLHPALAAADDYIRMFVDEGKLVSRLDHPNICEVHELGRDGADYFLAMPFLDGVPVTELIARPRDPDRRRQLRVAAGVIVQACAGLHHAHELRAGDGEPLHLVHRDASPSNLFVTTSGVVKVLDFGIAKVRGATATEIGMVKGKWQYMAPEQVAGEALDRRCDVFALGIVLFELATHQRLFKRDSEFLAARAVLEEPIPRADSVDPAVPMALADVIAKALARAKTDRYADCAELSRAIEAAIEIAPPSEIATALASDHAEELTKQRTRQLRVIEVARDTAVTTPRRPRASRRVGAIAAAAVVVAAAVVAVIATRGASNTGSTTGDTSRDPRSASTTVGGSTGVTDGSGGGAARNASTGIGDTSLDSRSASTAESGSTDVANGSTDVASGSIASRDRAGANDDRATTDGSNTAGPVGEHRNTAGSDRRDAPDEIEMPVDHLGAPAVAKPGLFSIDSNPFATIVVDGHDLGPTPIVHHALPAGKRRVHATLRDGRHKDFVVDIPAGRAAAPITLAW
jgi:serine/threonine-protein kinase